MQEVSAKEEAVTKQETAGNQGMVPRKQYNGELVSVHEEVTILTEVVDEDDLDLVEYLEAVLKRKRTVLLATLVAAVVSIAAVLLMPKVYESTAKILPPQQDQGIMGLMMAQMGGAGGLASLAGGVLGTVTPGDQYASILKSEMIQVPIIDRFRLMDEYNKKFRVDMLEKMDKIVEIKAGRKDGIISITVEDEDPNKAAQIANAYVDELGKFVAQMGMTDARKNNVFLTERLAQAKADLVRAEDALRVFQIKNKAFSVPDQAKASLEGVALLKAQLAAQETQLSSLRSQFTDTQPEVKAAMAAVRNTNAQIARLEGTGAGALPSMGSVPALGQEQIRLLREYKTQEMLVELLTKQFELTKIAEVKNVSSIQVIQKATPADKKSKPRRTLIVLAVTLLAMCCSTLWVSLKHYRSKLPQDEHEKWQRVRAAALTWKQPATEEICG